MTKAKQHDAQEPETGTGSDGDAFDSIGLVNEVRRIFNTRSWPIADEDPSEGGGAFERTLRMLALLEEEEAKLVLDLLARFVRIEFVQYMSEMKKLAKHLVRDIAPQRVVIIPIRSAKDSENKRIKSGDLMGVIARSSFSELSISVDAFSDLKAKPIRAIMNQPGSYMIGVDDFIGTGNTAVSFINDYLSAFPGCLSKLKLASLVSLESGVNAIQSRGAVLYCIHKLGKGISDHVGWDAAEKAQYIRTMVAIENRIGIQGKYQLGYGKSEGLVKMIRTPNNTFPAFWTVKTYNGTPWPATFPR